MELNIGADGKYSAVVWQPVLPLGILYLAYLGQAPSTQIKAETENRNRLTRTETFVSSLLTLTCTYRN